MSITERFLAKVDHTAGPEGCWLWTAATLSQGRYGAFHDGKTRHAHRVAYELWVGPIPDDLVIDHLCGTTLCVNPRHLEAVTQRENTMRSDNFMAVNARKTHCLNGHEFNEGNTHTRPNGQRVCRECNRLTKQRERAVAS